MATTVEAQIYGGTQHVDSDAMAAAAAQLTETSQTLVTYALRWETVQGHTALGITRMEACASEVFTAGRGEAVIHSPATFSRNRMLSTRASDMASSLRAYAAALTDLADLVTRAAGIYSAADDEMTGWLNRLVGSAAAQFLPASLLALLGLGFSAFRAGGGSEAGATVVNAADPLIEGTLRGIGARMAPDVPGIDGAQPVSKAASVLGFAVAALEGLFLGDRLTVTQPHPAVEPIGASASIADALANLQSLAADDSGVGYGTVAVQKYVDGSGTARWLVLIPGTDTHWDTAIGWGQNVELMSSVPAQRMHADSARLVMAAMENAGIGPEEPVSLVGHSQGGIVAATIAADAAKRYTISSVVTAGSPIANHPIPSSTWVTSIENKGEVVSSLDGARNPQRPTWLTVRGSFDFKNTQSSPLPATTVTGVPDRVDITHGLPYQRAALKDAESLGNSALQEHDRHFEESVKGRLMSSEYYTGRMDHGWPVTRVGGE